MSWLKTFTLSLEVIDAAVETLYCFGHSEDIKETQVWPFFFCPFISTCDIPAGGSHGSSALVFTLTARSDLVICLCVVFTSGLFKPTLW